MDLDVIEKVYRRYARHYDRYFGAVLQPGRQAIVKHMRCQPSDRVLEVGVGTGLSLPLYPRNVQVTGIDVCEDMLAGARTRVTRDKLGHITDLLRMDAEHMQFEDNSFDRVVAMYVVSVVPSPTRLINEMRRVCKPGGGLYIVNHFQHTNPVLARAERLLALFSRTVGFRSDLSLANFLRDTELEIIEQVPVNLFGYWTLLCAHNNKAATITASSRKTVQA